MIKKFGPQVTYMELLAKPVSLFKVFYYQLTHQILLVNLYFTYIASNLGKKQAVLTKFFSYRDSLTK